MFTFNKIRLIMIHVLKVFFHTTDTRIDEFDKIGNEIFSHFYIFNLLLSSNYIFPFMLIRLHP